MEIIERQPQKRVRADQFLFHSPEGRCDRDEGNFATRFDSHNPLQYVNHVFYNN